MTTIRSAAQGAALLLFCGSAAAQPTFRQTSYDVRHTFSFTPGNAAMPQVDGVYFAHAWVQESGYAPIAGWTPVAQDPGFDALGTDVGTFAGATNIPANGSPPVACLLQSFPIGPGGVNGGNCIIVTGQSCNAAACYDFLVWPYSLGTSIDGSIRSSGGTNVGAPARGVYSAYAFSTAFISVRGASQLASGQIVWTTFIDGVSGSTLNSIIRDPVRISASDGVVKIERTLLTIELSARAAASVHWDNDTLAVGSPEVSFSLLMDPQVVSAPGSLRFEVHGGAVTASSDSGIYAGLGPAPGTAVPFDIPLSNKIILDYDVNPILPGASDVEIKLSGSGDAPLHNCNADINGDGFMDGIDYDLFFNAFEEGNEFADYNGDGFVDGIDADLFNNHFELGCP